jgi:pimeloyl-ACP methyl ester carboxylesterase
MDTDFRTVTSRDGTVIAYERAGSGPALVLVGGAFCDRSFAGPLADLLERDFTVVTYDRRGRGDSGDTPPYAVSREVEDLAAVIAATGGPAYVFGMSSGAVLVLESAARGLPIRKLAMVEPPYSGDGGRAPIPNLAARYTELCAAGLRGEAIALFMTKAVGQPPEAVEQVRSTPIWPALEEMAHTLAYDAEVVGDGVLPADRAAAVTIPALAVESTASPQRLRNASRAVAAALPDGRHLVVPGRFHEPDPKLLAPELKRFFLGR